MRVSASSPGAGNEHEHEHESSHAVSPFRGGERSVVSIRDGFRPVVASGPCLILRRVCSSRSKSVGHRLGGRFLDRVSESVLWNVRLPGVVLAVLLAAGRTVAAGPDAP